MRLTSENRAMLTAQAKAGDLNAKALIDLDDQAADQGSFIAKVATTATHPLSGRAQTDSKQNGLYVAASGTWKRLKNVKGLDVLKPGLVVVVTKGTTYADTEWILTSDSCVVGTDNITFAQSVTAGISAADLASTSAGKGASLVGIQDALLRYTGTNVEAVVNESLVYGDLLTIEATAGAEAADAIEVACKVKDVYGNEMHSAREVVIKTLAVTDGEADLAAAGTPVGTLNKANNPAAGENVAWMTATSDGYFSFKVTDTAAEVVLVEILAEGCRPRLLKLTFA